MNGERNGLKRGVSLKSTETVYAIRDEKVV